MAIHLGPPVARRLMRPTRGLGSAPLPRRRLPARGLRPPIWPCSGWSLPVSLRSAACAVDRHRHCGTGPRLTAGGRYPPPCAAELGLSSRRPTGRPIVDAQPSDRLADVGRVYPCRRQPAGWPATTKMIEPPGPSRIIRPSGSIETVVAAFRAAHEPLLGRADRAVAAHRRRHQLADLIAPAAYW